MQPGVRELDQDQRRILVGNLCKDLAVIRDPDGPTIAFQEFLAETLAGPICDQLLEDAIRGTALAIQRSGLSPQDGAPAVATRSGVCITTFLGPCEAAQVELGTLAIGPQGVRIDDSLALDHGFTVLVPPGDYRVVARIDRFLGDDAYDMLAALSLIRSGPQLQIDQARPVRGPDGQKRCVYPDYGRIAIFSAHAIPHPEVNEDAIGDAEVAWDLMLSSFKAVQVTTVPGFPDSPMFCSLAGSDVEPVVAALNPAGTVVALHIVLTKSDIWSLEPDDFSPLATLVNRSDDAHEYVGQPTDDTGPRSYARDAHEFAALGMYGVAARSIRMAQRLEPEHPTWQAAIQVQHGILKRWRRAAVIGALLLSVGASVAVGRSALALVPALAAWVYVLRSAGRNLVPMLQVGLLQVDGRRQPGPVLLLATLIAELLTASLLIWRPELVWPGLAVTLVGVGGSLTTVPSALRLTTSDE